MESPFKCIIEENTSSGKVFKRFPDKIISSHPNGGRGFPSLHQQTSELMKCPKISPHHSSQPEHTGTKYAFFSYHTFLCTHLIIFLRRTVKLVC